MTTRLPVPPRIVRMLPLLMVCMASPALAQGVAVTEYQLKAVFLYNFAKYVSWPEDKVNSATEPIVIGVLGQDPFDGKLEETVRDKYVDQRALVVRHFRDVEQAAQAHILFIGESESRKLPDILATLAEHPVLTVGDSADFTKQGGIVRFYLEQDRVKLEIDNSAAERAGIRISSQLLRIARVVGHRSGGRS